MLTTVLGICIISAVFILFLRQYKPEFALITAVASGVLILLIIIFGSTGFFDEIKSLFSSVGISSEIIAIVIKSLGICYLTNFTADLCRDFGQTSLAGKVELTGKISVAVISFPLVKLILNTALELIG